MECWFSVETWLRWQKVFGGFRKAEAPGGGWPGVPTKGENGEPVEGRAMVLYLNGDKYVGEVNGGKKNGLGMYVYADLTAYKGNREMDHMYGTKHPFSEKDQNAQDLGSAHSKVQR